MKQLVIADRAIENDQILRDRVLSTMNGYVDDFQVISSRTVPGPGGKSIEIVADVTVSSARIENFLGSTSGNTALVNTDNLLADVQREKASRKARTEILLRLFDPYPMNAIEVTVNSIRPDTQSPDHVHIDFSVKPREAFVKQLRDGLKQLGGSESPSPSSGKAILKQLLKQRGLELPPAFRQPIHPASRAEQYPSSATVCFSDLYRGEMLGKDNAPGQSVLSAQSGIVGGAQPSGCTTLPSVDLTVFATNQYRNDSFGLRVLYAWDVGNASVAFIPEPRDGGPYGSRTGNPLFAIQRDTDGNGRIWLETRLRNYRITLSANAIPENARAIHILPFMGEMSMVASNVKLADNALVLIAPFGDQRTAPLGNVRDSLEKELNLIKIGDK